MVLPLIAVVNIAVVVIVRGAQAQHKANAARVARRQSVILQQIVEAIVGIFDGKAAVRPDGIGAEPAVTGADEV